MSDESDALQNLFATVSLGAPENAVGFVLWRIMHRYQRAIDRALAPADLTHLQFTALAMAGWLARSGMSATQTALAKAGDIHPMQVSQVLKVLEAKGLLTRVRDPADVRAKRLQVTSTGVNVLRVTMPLVIAVQHRMFGAAGLEGGSLLTALQRLEADNRDGG